MLHDFPLWYKNFANAIIQDRYGICYCCGILPCIFQIFVLFFKGLSFFLQYLSCFVKVLKGVLTSFSIFSSRFASASVLSRPNADLHSTHFRWMLWMSFSGTVIVSCSGQEPSRTHRWATRRVIRSFRGVSNKHNNKIKKKKKKKRKKKKKKKKIK